MRGFLTIVLAFLVSTTFGQDSPSDSIGFRLKKTINYECKSFSIPDDINESTVDKVLETEYSYINELVVGISRTFYLGNQIKIEYDSVIYLAKDSVSIFRKSENSVVNFNLKLTDFQELKNRLTTADSFYFYFDYHNLIVKKDKQKELMLIQIYRDSQDTLKLTYRHDSLGKRHEIEEINLKSKSRSLMKLSYNRGHIFSISSSYGMFSTFEKYHFNEYGLLQKEGKESDTNASLRVFEYERGKGNSGSFVNNIYDVLYCKPLIK